MLLVMSVLSASTMYWFLTMSSHRRKAAKPERLKVRKKIAGFGTHGRKHLSDKLYSRKGNKPCLGKVELEEQ